MSVVPLILPGIAPLPSSYAPRRCAPLPSTLLCPPPLTVVHRVDAPPVLLALRPLPLVRLAAGKQVHPVAVRKVLLVCALVAVAVGEAGGRWVEELMADQRG